MTSTEICSSGKATAHVNMLSPGLCRQALLLKLALPSDEPYICHGAEIYFVPLLDLIIETNPVIPHGPSLAGFDC